MYDVVDIIKNLQTLTINDSAFQILKDFERVLDELDIYVFKSWEDGELLAGPEVNRYFVTCKFMWKYKNMPDPDGAKVLTDYGCKVSYEKTHLLVPRKVYKPEDFRPGTKKGKIDAHSIWIVTISMPKRLMQDIYQGYKESDNQRLADLMRFDSTKATPPQSIIPEQQPPEAGSDASLPAPPL